MIGKALFGVAVISATLCFGSDVVSFETLMQALEKSSPKLEHQRLQTKISQESLRSAEAGYLPSLSLGGTSEYSRKFNNNTTASYVGSDSLTQSTQYQNSSTLGVNYDLFRFGATALGVKAASAQIQASKAGECLALKEQLESLLETYAKVRIATIKLEHYKQIQKLYQESYIMAKRLNEAGELAQTEVITYAQYIADQFVLSAQTQEEKESMLAHLMYLADIKLDTSTSFESLHVDKIMPLTLSFEQSTKAKQAYAQIEQKSSQLKAEKTRYLPVFSLYGKYDLYGSDDDRFGHALQDVDRNGYRVGLSFSWSLFDGFAREAAVETRLLELQQAKIGLIDAKREFEKEQYLLRSQSRERETRLANAKQSEESSSKFADMMDALNKNGQKDKLSTLKSQIQYHQTMIASKEAQELLYLSQKKEILFTQKEYECVVH
ncbi:MAG: TolC family protein [Sulfurospirillaceae bacterium]|nr:TolC family protein [Sulfurospirillaceae bacterium]